MASTFTCPRCFYAGAVGPALRFCPRCGLADVVEAAADTSPLDLTVGEHVYHVLDRIAVGSICSVYRCRFKVRKVTDWGERQVEGVFKIARDPRTNDLLTNEAKILESLHGKGGSCNPFLPALQESFAVGEGGQPVGEGEAAEQESAAPGQAPRQANVLRMHPQVRSPDQLYTLAEVRREYPAGLDARDMAWVWRRLLYVLSLVHTRNIVHAAVLPPHVLIEPAGHKLVLVDWCCASNASRDKRKPITFIAGGYASWYGRSALSRPATPGLDIALATRCMIALVGGDPARAQFPAGFEPALVRYFQRCLGVLDSESRRDATTAASELLGDFDRLIEALWGPRKFRPLVMPAKGM